MRVHSCLGQLIVMAMLLAWCSSASAQKHALMQDDVSYVNPLQYGSALNATTLNAAITGIGSNKRALFLSTGAWTLAANVTVPSNVTLIIPAGSTVAVNAGITLTINGPYHAALEDWHTGTVIFNNVPLARICEADARDYASIGAAVTTIGTKATRLCVTRQHTLSANTTFNANTTLVFAGAGSFSVNAGVTLTVQGIEATPNQRIFYGAGTVRCGSKCPLVLHPGWFGAVYDDATDDAAAINSAVTMAGDTTVTLRAGRTVQIAGPAAIGSTVLIERKSVTLMGGGAGANAASVGPWLRWIGAANTAMVECRNTHSGCGIKQLRILGGTNAADAILITQDSVGFPAQRTTVENVHIGSLTGEREPANFLRRGISITGSISSNNELHHFSNVIIDGPTGECMRIDGIQNINITIQNSILTTCPVGIRSTTQNLLLNNVQILGNTTAALYYPSTDKFDNSTHPRTTALNLSNEGSARLLHIEASGSFIGIGGYSQVSSLTNADGKWIRADLTTGDQQILLFGFHVTQGSAPPTAPFIALNPGGNAGEKAFVCEVCSLGPLTGGGTSTPFNNLAPATAASGNWYIRLNQGGGIVSEDYIPANGSFVLRQAGAYTRGFDTIDFGRIVRPSSAIQAITAAGNTILSEVYNNRISNTTGGSITLTSVPTITQPGTNFDGQMMLLVNVGTQDIVLQDHDTLVGSQLQLTAASITLTPNDSVSLIWQDTLAQWLQIGPVVNVP